MKMSVDRDGTTRVVVTSEDTAPHLLREAARLVEAAAVRLNMRHASCKHCGAVRHDDRTHLQAYNRISDVPHKLVDVANNLEAK